MLIPKTSVIPPGGFHFIDTSSGVPVRIEGDSADDVANKLLLFRTRNGLPPGNPLEEYRKWLCESWPHFCIDSSPPAVPSGSGVAHISSRVATWMADFIRNYRGSDLVLQSEADRRAGICAECPRNVLYNATGCGSCLESISRLSFIYRASRVTKYDDHLRACMTTAQHNGSAVWASKLPPADPSTLPSHCWRRP